jgi:hypothetical protein
VFMPPVGRARIRALHRQDVWLGGALESDDSFPLTDREHLPAKRMFLPALTFLSWASVDRWVDFSSSGYLGTMAIW